jgi:hypothetical protein
MPSTTVTVHPGLHKTASSFIQTALKTARPDFRRTTEILLKDVNSTRELPVLGDLFTACRRNHTPDVDAISARVGDLRDALDKAGIDIGKNLVISDEDLFGRFRLDKGLVAYEHAAAGLAVLKNVFGDRLRLVVYLRNPVHYFLSGYIQIFQSGGESNWNDYQHLFDAKRLNLHAIAQALATQLEPEHCRFVLFDEIKRDPLAYCNAILQFGPERLTERHLPTKVVNESLSAPALKIAEVAFPSLDTDARKALRRFLLKHVKGAKFFPFTPEQIGTYFDQAKPDLDRLAAMMTPAQAEHIRKWADVSSYFASDKA